MACKIWDVDNEKYSYYSRKEILEFLQNKQDLIKTYFSYGYLPAVPRDGMFAVTTSDQSLWYSKNKSWNKIAGGSGSSGSEVDPIYTADKPLLARKTDLVNLQTKTDNRLNSIVADGNLVSAILDIDANAKFLNEYILTIDNLLAQSLAELQDKDEELQVLIDNEATIRSAADTIQLNKINANTSQISANTTSITTNKNLQDLVNTQYLNKITALENKTGKLIVTKNTGETDAQALARVITAPVDGMAAFVYDPNAHGNSNNLTEYLRINGTWIEQGTHTATVDLTAYYTKTESDAKFIDTVELQNLFNAYFDWLGAKTFTVGDRLPDATAQPTTGVLADVGKITTWENQDWMLFEINQAGTLTYSWLPVAQGGSLSKGDTLHRDSVVEFFTSPDALKNIKILAGSLDTINYTFAEGVSGNLEVAPNATGQTTIGKFNLNNIDTAVKANTSKNTQQDTAIAGKQPKTDPNLATASKDTTGSINEVLELAKKTSMTPMEISVKPDGSYYTSESELPTPSENEVGKIYVVPLGEGYGIDYYLYTSQYNQQTKQYTYNRYKIPYLNELGTWLPEAFNAVTEVPNKQPKTLETPITGYTATDVEGTLHELDTKKQNKAISLSGITATNVEGALVELAGKGGGISNPIGNFTNGFMETKLGAYSYQIIAYPNINDKNKAVQTIYDKGYNEYRIENNTGSSTMILGVLQDGIRFRNGSTNLFEVYNNGKHSTTATHTINQILDTVDTNYTAIGTIAYKQNATIAIPGLTATTVNGALSELNTNKLNIAATGVTFDANGHVIDGTTNTGKNYTEYIVGKSLAGLPASPIIVSTAISSSSGYVTWSKTKTFAIGEEFTIITHKSDKTHANIIKLTSLSQNINLGLDSSGTLNLTVVNGNINNVNIDLTPVDWVKVVY